MAINLEMLKEKARDIRIDIIREVYPRDRDIRAARFPRPTSSRISISRR